MLIAKSHVRNIRDGANRSFGAICLALGHLLGRTEGVLLLWLSTIYFLRLLICLMPESARSTRSDPITAGLYWRISCSDDAL